MDIRYFTNGKLNYTWFGVDLDDDNVMWSLRGYEYSEHLREQARQILRTQKMNDLRWVKKVDIDATMNSHTAWKLVRTPAKLDIAYGQSEYDKVCSLIKEIVGIQEAFATD